MDQDGFSLEPPPVSREEERRARRRIRYAKNIEQERARCRAYRERHPEEHKARTRKWRSENPERVKELQEKWYKENRDYALQKASDRALIRKYGINRTTYNEIMRTQNWKCKLCKLPFNSKIPELRPNLDHCHTTGRIRHILCSKCNVGLGIFQDNPRLLRRAARYLEWTAADVPLQANPDPAAAEGGRAEQAG